MSGANSWLQRQRKGDLAELAQHTGLKNFEAFKKPELELALDEYLAENSTTFSSDPKLAPYYSSRARTIGSPLKRGSIASDGTEEKIKVPRRRTIKAVEDAPTLPPALANAIAVAPEPVSESEPVSEEEPATSTAIATTTGISNALVQTPGRALSLASRIPLPATPADIAEAVDRHTVALRNSASSIYKESGITEVTHATRESLSTVNSILGIVSLFELYFLRPEVLPDRYAFTIPAIHFLGTNDFPVHVADLFLLLTSSFWSPTLTWLFTSTILPTLAGYFFNLSAANQPTRRTTQNTQPSPDYVVDPLTFSIVKALISFVVYGQGVTFGGWLSEESIARINGSVYGGYKGVLTGTAITALISIYDAVLKK
ncbi:hypothetical protein E8E14_003897 [Neopestalotiopsis sp. 37M]|nr:hypothetical protein E8E14_003897 [Neopestalotiopsis sp. 37M]